MCSQPTSCFLPALQELSLAAAAKAAAVAAIFFPGSLGQGWVLVGDWERQAGFLDHAGMGWGSSGHPQSPPAPNPLSLEPGATALLAQP